MIVDTYGVKYWKEDNESQFQKKLHSGRRIADEEFEDDYFDDSEKKNEELHISVHICRVCLKTLLNLETDICEICEILLYKDFYVYSGKKKCRRWICSDCRSENFINKLNCQECGGYSISHWINP